jgi:hypothetical protein
MSKSLKFFPQNMNHAKLLLLLFCVAMISACSTLAGKEETGVVIARRAQVRSSTAVVAADLKEVVRGEVVDILDSTTADNGEQWLRVRTREADNVEGWIEARNVMPQELLDRSRSLGKEDQSTPAQATGQLRASTNLRFSPDRNGNDNILMKLESGARFEIVGWKRVPKPKTSETTESDDTPKAGAAQRSEERSRRDGDEPKVPEEAEELWYKVRLPPSISPAPAGWIYGKQVELTVPSDIIFYRTGREFVAWQRLDEAEPPDASKEDETAREVQPGSWVILEKSSSSEANKPGASDFDRIFVLGYDKERQEHYTAYRSPDLEGYLPLHVQGQGDDKIFTVNVHHGGQKKEANFKAFSDSRGMLRVDALDEFIKEARKK